MLIVIYTSYITITFVVKLPYQISCTSSFCSFIHLKNHVIPLLCDYMLISTMISDIEHIYTCLLDICVSSLEKCLFMPVAHLWLSVVFSSFRNSLYFGYNLSSDIWFANLFSHSVGCLSILLILSFDSQILKIFLKFSLSNFSFSVLPLVSYPRIHKAIGFSFIKILSQSHLIVEQMISM